MQEDVSFRREAGAYAVEGVLGSVCDVLGIESSELSHGTKTIFS